MRIMEPSTPDEFEDYYTLRWRILRAPWNQPRGSERDTLEDTSRHFMVVGDEGKPVAVGRLQFNSIREAQIRYMAVDINHQRKGIGTTLLRAMEQQAIRLGAARIVLDARENALRFYRKQGYVPQGPGHTLFNSITHIKMTKPLGSQPSPYDPAP